VPFPDRISCSTVCKQWSSAARHISFVLHVYPVEMGAAIEHVKLDINHFRNFDGVMPTILPGDTIELGDGHYWLNDGLDIDVPLRIVGDERDPTNVVLELSGCIKWKGKAGWIEGVTLQRPRVSSNDKNLIFQFENGSCNIVHSIMNNTGSMGTILKCHHSCIQMLNVTLRGEGKNNAGIFSYGIDMDDGSKLQLNKCRINSNSSSGIRLSNRSFLNIDECILKQNSKFGIEMIEQCLLSGKIADSVFVENESGDIMMDDSCKILDYSSTQLSCFDVRADSNLVSGFFHKKKQHFQSQLGFEHTPDNPERVDS